MLQLAECFKLQSTNNDYGVLQLAEWCRLQQKIKMLVFCNSPSAINYDRKSIFWCAAIAGNLQPVAEVKPETMRECMRGAHSVSNHKHCMIENQYSGVLQLAECCKLQ